jgi:alcohol dehydrogenase YqhD (iron-dependent ADH family)
MSLIEGRDIVKDFVYQMPVKVYFGENSVKRYLKDELKHYGKNIMLAYGQESIKRNGIYDEVIEVLGECEKNIIDFPGISANPTYEKVLDGIRLYKENNVDLILAIGGGSVIDCCKVICSGTEINEDIWEVQLEKGLIPENMGNFAVILTLSGAGAEMDCLGAVTYEKRHEKKTLTGPYAKFVIEDPNYIMTVPLKVFMPGVFDSLTHCMETYFGKTTNVSDLLNEGLMKDIIYNMRELIHGNDSLEVRSNLMWDSSLVQTFLFNVGKPGDFQAHKIENALGAYSHGTHGQQLAVIQPAYYRAVYNGDISKFTRFSRVIMEIHDKDSEENIALKGIEALEKLIKEAQLSTTFTELGYELTEDIARTVSQTCEISKTGPRELTREEIYELLLRCK